ncbi:MAG: SAVED domain-containing protein [Pseudomonadaceae bacterium]|nr:SAVED domain-containing protein [Pseudomonadaceae bacterium]
MVAQVKRAIPANVQRELWARAAGRCQFSGCNRLLYKSSVTQESVNAAQQAHIWSFSEEGPRGWGPFRTHSNRINDISNLMLMCHECHKKIDQHKDGGRYPADLLVTWKSEHETRVEIVTGIEPDKKSHVLLYGANIGTEKSPIVLHDCVKAMFPDWYPANERPVILSMNSELKDKQPEYWQAEAQQLIQKYEREVLGLIEQDDCKHFSVFAIAPQPLLIKLGTLLTDKVSVETYQPHREPKGWVWKSGLENLQYIIHQPEDVSKPPALVFALSDHVTHDRIYRVLEQDVSIWEVTLERPHNDFLQSRSQLSSFRQIVRALMVEIKNQHGNDTPLRVFPVMPAACAIEFGRARIPKAEMPWVLFDHDYNTQEFHQTIEIRGNE